MLLVVVAQRVAGVDALALAGGGDALDLRDAGHRERDGELADHGLLVERLDAVEGGQRPARVVGALEQELAQLDEAAPTQPGQVHDAAERVEGLGGADVRRRLLASDVLLAGLERQDEAAAPVDVGRLAGDAARHAAQVGLGRGEEPERGTAEVQAVAERLPLPHGDVDAALARRLEDPERDRVVRADHDGRRRLGGRRERLGVLDGAEEVRLLEDDRRGVAVDGLRPGVGVGDAVAQPDLDDLDPVAVRVGRERLAAVRVHAARDDDAALAVRELGQVGRGRHGARTLVDRRVGHGQRRELADGGLELEHDLQAALRDLGLVGRVRREELRSRHEHVHERGDVVVVHPAAEEGDLVLGGRVAAGQLAQPRVDRLLALALGEVEAAVEPQRLGDRGEELVDRAHADLVEHLPEVVGGGGGVAAHGSRSRSGCWCRRRAPSGSPARLRRTAAP